ncbi:MAG: methyltransferase domain-containing protein [Sphingomicrobium sp.]
MLPNRVIAEERMDAEDLPADVYAKVLADLSKVNAWTMAQRPTLAFLERAVGERKSFRLLDVGFGHGDMLRRIARWAKKRDVACELVGVDLNARSESVARAATPSDFPIRYVTGDYRDQAGPFDFIVSSLVAHHMSDDQLLEFLRFMTDRAHIGWLVNDLHRHGFSYMGYPLLALIMGWHEIVRQDGRLSIARSYRPDEWRAVLASADVDGAQVERFFPFRLSVSWLR